MPEPSEHPIPGRSEGLVEVAGGAEAATDASDDNGRRGETHAEPEQPACLPTMDQEAPAAPQRVGGATGVESSPAVNVVRVLVPLKLCSGMNSREHWRARKRRVEREHRAVAQALAGHRPPELPATVLLERVGWAALDSDNLASAFKSARDAIADWFDLDDRSPLLHWRLSQQVCRERTWSLAGGWQTRAEVAIVVRPWRRSDGRDPLRVLPASRGGR